MSVDTQTTELIFTGIAAEVPISVDMKAFTTDTIFVYYGDTQVPATQGTDFTVDLNFTTFNDFVVTPHLALINHINALILSNPAEVNKIFVRRQLPLTSDFEETDAFIRRKIANEFDLTIMKMQQLNLFQATLAPDRNVRVSIYDTTPGILPNAAARAGQMLGFDSNGFVIAAQPASALVSTVMQPVVNASSLILARMAFGLGATAILGIGAGLQDDGAGKLRFNCTTTNIAANQAILAANDMQRFNVSTALTLTLQLSTNLFNGFGFWVNTNGGDCTLSPSTGDLMQDMPAINLAVTIPDGCQVFVHTDGAGKWYVDGMPWLSPIVKNITGFYNVTAADNGRILNHQGGAFGTIIFPSPTTLPKGFRCHIFNNETVPLGKGIGGTNLGTFTLYPTQGYTIGVRNGIITVLDGGLRPHVVNTVQIYCDQGAGSDNPLVSDGLGGGARARKTLQSTKTMLYADFNHNGSQPVCWINGVFSESITFGGQPVNTGVFFWNGLSPGAYTHRPASSGQPYCFIIGDGGICEFTNLWTDGNGITSVAIQLHQTAICDILSGCSFGSHGNVHFGMDGAGMTLNVSANYVIIGAGGAGAHIQLVAVGCVNVSGSIVVTISGALGAPNVGTWFSVTGPGLISCGTSIVWSGSTLGGGKKWQVGPGGVLFLGGNAANVPGTVAGTPAVSVAPTSQYGWAVA